MGEGIRVFLAGFFHVTLEDLARVMLRLMLSVVLSWLFALYCY